MEQIESHNYLASKGKRGSNKRKLNLRKNFPQILSIGGEQ
jgi:hypothetical protein